MVRKGSSVLILALLLSLPACWQKKEKKEAPPKKEKAVALIDADEPNNEEFDVAVEDIRSFFDEMDKFAKLDDCEFDLVDEGDEFNKAEFAFADDEETKKLDTVYFAYDKSSIDSGQVDKVAAAAEEAKQLLAEARAEGFDAQLVVAGYSCVSPCKRSDNPESLNSYNEKISQKRAKSVAAMLAENGIDEDDIAVRGLGGINLLVESGDKDEQWQNRRVELDIVYS